MLEDLDLVLGTKTNFMTLTLCTFTPQILSLAEHYNYQEGADCGPIKPSDSDQCPQLLPLLYVEADPGGDTVV